VAVVVPGKAEGATSEWRRLIRTIDSGTSGAFALNGPRLDAGAVYELPYGAVVLIVDRFPDRWHVRMATADLTGLETVHEWTTKSPLGKRVVDYIARRLPADAETYRYVRLEAMPNRWPSWCRRCRGPVPAQAGRVENRDGHNIVTHHPGQCPPPPEIVTPNRYAGLCMACGGWVAASAGSALRRTAPKASGGRYEPIHGTPEGSGCPDNPTPGPPNRSPGWCHDCGELVDGGHGYWLHDRLHHADACPPAMAVPTWISRPRRTLLKVGEVARVRIETGGRDNADRPAIPQDAPGYRILQVGYVEMVGVVVETLTGERQRARIRAATADEAAAVLAACAADIPLARPDVQGFKARFEVERISGNRFGPSLRPWLAEITGRDPRMGFERDFMESDRDYSNANSRGTRGVTWAWTLGPNRVYEAFYPVSRSRTRRVFLRTTPEGDVKEISEQEVEAWLDNAAPWIAN